MILQLLALVVIIGLGIELSFIARRAAMHGFEIWLPLAILVSFGISPLAGYIAGMLVVLGGFFLWPYALENIAIMGTFLAAVCWATKMFTLTEGNLMLVAMGLTVAYNAVSNTIYFLKFGDLFSTLKFVVLSLWLSWLIYANIGWQFVSWLASG